MVLFVAGAGVLVASGAVGLVLGGGVSGTFPDSHPAIHGARLRPSLAADGPARCQTHLCRQAVALLVVKPFFRWPGVSDGACGVG